MITHCNHCLSSDLVTDYAAGDIICRNCATVICDRVIETDAEWRVYADDDRGNSLSGARAEKQSDNTGLQRTMLVGGSTATRKALTKSHMESSLTKIESNIIENMSIMVNLGSRLGLPIRATVSSHYICLKSIPHN